MDRFIEVEAVEEIKADFIDTDYIVEPIYKMSRVDVGGSRHYIKEDDGVLTQAPAFTTIMNKVAPISYYIIQWQIEKGKEKAKWLLKNSANYGTYLHVLCGQYLLGQSMPLSSGLLMLCMQGFFEEKNFDFSECLKWMKEEGRDLRKDIYGFSRFCRDFSVKPLAIEYPMMLDDRYACTLDIVCKMTYKKEIITALIDIKSGQKGFHESHEIQLEAQKQAWNAEFPNQQIDRVFNYGSHNYRLPLSSRVTPYKLKDQTDSTNAYKWELYVKLWHGDVKKQTIKPVTDFNGDSILTIDKEPEDVFVEIDHLDYEEVVF